VPSPWNPRSIALIVLVWLVLHIGCLFTPGLLDDVDSVYIEVAREMLVRHDYVTPYIDGVRFFDKPPLMYWLAAGSMRIFGAYDWAARLPIALLTLALFLAVYALGLRLLATPPWSSRSAAEGSAAYSPGRDPDRHPDRAALYAALALATSLGPFLYTRFFIPDILICLWMTLAVHAFLLAINRIQSSSINQDGPGAPSIADGRDVKGPECQVSPQTPGSTLNSSLIPSLAFAALTALNLLTKGFIGLIFPLAFAFLYLALTRQLRLLSKLHLIPSTLLFLAIAAPWHILATLRNPAIALPPNLGLPAHGGWTWFYLYNEHIARFLSRRIPHDYGQVPIWLFWLLAALWLFPWTAFLPGAIAQHLRTLRRVGFPTKPLLFNNPAPGTPRQTEAALALLLWAALILVFFTFSARQEYYSLPALPALALMAGGLLARADNPADPRFTESRRSAHLWHRWLLVPLGLLTAAIALFFAIAAPPTDPHTDIATLLAQGGAYNLSLGHVFDLTAPAMGLFRGPLVLFALAMLAIGPLTYRLRRRGLAHAANLTLAAAAACLLLNVHEGLVRFYPTLGSKQLALAIVRAEAPTCNSQPATCNSWVLIDGELTAGSSLLFYTRQPAHLVDGRINGPWYGSFWPDAPPIFETEATLDQLWAGPRRIFLLTYRPAARTASLSPFGPVHTLAAAGGKSILTNQP
jgi:4-amino-4-deoxy-L-arabinose transferase-like glycosyltransferase